MHAGPLSHRLSRRDRHRPKVGVALAMFGHETPGRQSIVHHTPRARAIDAQDAATLVAIAVVRRWGRFQLIDRWTASSGSCRCSPSAEWTRATALRHASHGPETLRLVAEERVAAKCHVVVVRVDARVKHPRAQSRSLPHGDRSGGRCPEVSTSRPSLCRRLQRSESLERLQPLDLPQADLRRNDFHEQSPIRADVGIHQ